MTGKSNWADPTPFNRYGYKGQYESSKTADSGASQILAGFLKTHKVSFAPSSGQSVQQVATPALHTFQADTKHGSAGAPAIATPISKDVNSLQTEAEEVAEYIEDMDTQFKLAFESNDLTTEQQDSKNARAAFAAPFKLISEKYEDPAKIKGTFTVDVPANIAQMQRSRKLFAVIITAAIISIVVFVLLPPPGFILVGTILLSVATVLITLRIQKRLNESVSTANRWEQLQNHPEFSKLVKNIEKYPIDADLAKKINIKDVRIADLKYDPVFIHLWSTFEQSSIELNACRDQYNEAIKAAQNSTQSEMRKLFKKIQGITNEMKALIFLRKKAAYDIDAYIKLAYARTPPAMASTAQLFNLTFETKAIEMLIRESNVALLPTDFISPEAIEKLGTPEHSEYLEQVQALYPNVGNQFFNHDLVLFRIGEGLRQSRAAFKIGEALSKKQEEYTAHIQERNQIKRTAYDDPTYEYGDYDLFAIKIDDLNKLQQELQRYVSSTILFMVQEIIHMNDQYGKVGINRCSEALELILVYDEFSKKIAEEASQQEHVPGAVFPQRLLYPTPQEQRMKVIEERLGLTADNIKVLTNNAMNDENIAQSQLLRLLFPNGGTQQATHFLRANNNRKLMEMDPKDLTPEMMKHLIDANRAYLTYQLLNTGK